MTADPRIAALAEALIAQFSIHAVPYDRADDLAAAILAALPPDWCGHDEEALLNRYDLNVVAPLEVENVRLRKIEEAVRPRHASSYHRAMVPGCVICAALEAE